MSAPEEAIKVSIITPTMNQGKFIEETIVSVIRQDYPNIEYLIIDGGSNDETRRIVEKYRGRIAVFVSEQDSGQSSAINKGVRLSTGDVLLWLNSDDMLTEGAVRTAVRALVERPDVDLVYSDFWGLDDETGKLTRWKSKQVDLATLIKRNIVPQPTVFMRRRLFERIGPVEESLHLTMDWQLWLRAARVSRLLYLPEPCLAVLRDHPGAKTRALYGRRVEEQLLILHRLYGDPTLPRAVRRNRRISYSHVYWEAAEHAMLRGQSFPQGIGWLARSVVSHPIGAMSRPLTTFRIVWSALRDVAHSSVYGHLLGARSSAAPDPASERRAASSHERAPFAARIYRDQADGRRPIG